MKSTCPICEHLCDRERLNDDWLVCGRTFLAFHLDADGHIDAWSTTSKSHPKGVRSVRADLPERRRQLIHWEEDGA